MSSLAHAPPITRAARPGEAAQSAISFGAAMGIHLLLAAALVVSIDWRTEDLEVVQAELWSSLPAERPPISPPEPPAPKPTPEPEKPAPPPDPTPPAPAADIALKKAKEEAAKKEASKRAQEERDKAAKARALQEKQAQEKQARERAAQRQREALRQAELDRINKSLGLDAKAKASSQGKDVASKAGVAGGAEQGVRSGLLAGYQDAIRSRIRSRILGFDPARAPTNPEVIYIVEQLPTGQISRIQLQKASGMPEWDAAVLRAIKASDPLPKADDGSVERRLELRFRPGDKR
ncbi:MAG: cell envelope integrity protein TolA [Burkholderiaceae bacterium]|jgi:colicin import membrane protein